MEYHNCNGGRVSIIEPAFLSEMINTYRKKNVIERSHSNPTHLITHIHTQHSSCAMLPFQQILCLCDKTRTPELLHTNPARKVKL